MTEISIKKPYRRWLFGGIGFHNSEATMAPVMNEKFKNEAIDRLEILVRQGIKEDIVYRYHRENKIF